MSYGKYRKYDKLLKSEMSDYQDDEVFVLLSEVVNSMDEIESKVNTIRDIIEDINGLDIIDGVKDQLNTLSNDLY